MIVDSLPLAAGQLPWPALATIILLAFGALIASAAIRPVRDPNRAVIYRLATLHRVAGPGLIVMLPLVERIEGVLPMGEREMLLVPSAVRTADNHLLKMRLEVTWGMHPHVSGRPSEEVRATLLLPEERRGKLVDEVVTRAAGRVLASYALSELASPTTRDEVMVAVTAQARAELAEKGLWVERVFWRV